MTCCAENEAALSALFDGELPEPERAALLAHLETCEGCRTYLAALGALHNALTALPEHDAPEGFTESVLARVRAEKITRRRTRLLHRFVPAVCAAALLLCAGLLLFPHYGRADKADGTECVMADTAAPGTAEVYSFALTSNTAESPAAPAAETAPEESARCENDVPLMLQSAAPHYTGGETGAFDPQMKAADCAPPNDAALPRADGALRILGAARRDYLIEYARELVTAPDGETLSYALPAERRAALCEALERDGVAYCDESGGDGAYFTVCYEEGGEGNG